MLERTDADALIKDFNLYGEVVVIDLDATLGNINEKGETSNTALLKNLLRKGNVLTGGGVRSVKRAGEILNTAFLNELTAAIGKERIIISVDAINGKIAVKGWTETVGISLIDGAKSAEKYADELLFTCVEKEGCMQGTNLDQFYLFTGFKSYICSQLINQHIFHLL